MESIFDVVSKFSKEINDGRTMYKVLTHLTEELGELATEVQIREGNSYKNEGVDGVLGEAIDVIVVAMDLIYLNSSQTTEQQIIDVVRRKCEKWKDKTIQRLGANCVKIS